MQPLPRLNRLCRRPQQQLPQGAYRDGQFADPESDVSLFTRAKAAEIVRFRRRMAALLAESRPETAAETLGDRERVLLGAANPAGDPEARRSALAAAGVGGATPGAVREAGRAFGVEVTDVSLPFRPAFFGRARFGTDRLADRNGCRAVAVRASGGTAPARGEFEARARAVLLATNVVHFVYEQEAEIMAGMYPDERKITILGEEVSRPGLDPDTGRFTNGDFSDPMQRPSFIPAETLNLLLDNLAGLIEAQGGSPDSSGAGQLRDAVARGLAGRLRFRGDGSRVLSTPPTTSRSSAARFSLTATRAAATAIPLSAQPAGCLCRRLRCPAPGLRERSTASASR